MTSITENVKSLRVNVPNNIIIVAAAKSRTPEEIKEALEAEIKVIGENYLQEAEEAYDVLGKQAEWHYIGHLQRNKIKKIVQIFDMIETVNSFQIAEEIDKKCEELGKKIQILIEINIASEPQKSGVLPEKVEETVDAIMQKEFKNLQLSGLMTMGPFLDDPEKLRPYFRKANTLFHVCRERYPTAMRFLSMGMSDSWGIGVEEGANMVRIGTAIFGSRT